jgi:hypothetical protein
MDRRLSDEPSRLAKGELRSKLAGRTILILSGVAVILRLGQEIFVPLALSLLRAFRLAPIVSFLRKRSIPRIPAVLPSLSLLRRYEAGRSGPALRFDPVQHFLGCDVFL